MECMYYLPLNPYSLSQIQIHLRSNTAFHVLAKYTPGCVPSILPTGSDNTGMHSVTWCLCNLYLFGLGLKKKNGQILFLQYFNVLHPTPLPQSNPSLKMLLHISTV